MRTQAIHVKTLILGAGLGGLGVAAQLVRDGDADFLIVDRAAGLGGVWRHNDYPGAACDTESHLYCYSFFPHYTASEKYANRKELLGYMQRLAIAYNLETRLLLNCEVASAKWDRERRIWCFQFGDGRRYTSNFFVAAWGQLNRPSIPDFPERAKYRGHMFHSAEWDKSIDLSGKRVACIGNAASVVQFVPVIAPKVGNLTVFQRSANWIMPRNQMVFTQEQLVSFSAEPQQFEQSRLELHQLREEGYLRMKVGSREQLDAFAVALQHLTEQVSDKTLRSALTPDYELGCKRILKSDDYYPALCRDNVQLETRRIKCFYDEGIVTSDGVEIPFDVIIFGTGFASQDFFGDIDLRGYDGDTLAQAWENGPEAYLGIAVANFPNMFMVYGPNTNITHNSIVPMLEIQQNYITSAIKDIGSGQSVVMVRDDIFQSFNRNIQSELTSSVFSSGCSNWYTNADGKVINNWPGTIDQYRMAAAWRAADYSWE